MYIGFLDEAGHTSPKNFTVCGLTALEADKVSELSEKIEMIRSESGHYDDTDLLKFQSNSKPLECDVSLHTDLKAKVVEAAKDADATFLGYAYFNGASKKFESDRNRIFGFNTLIAKFGKFLEAKSDHGIVVIDRLDLSKKSVLGYASGFDYIRDKFQKGNEVHGNWHKHQRILSYSITCEGSSHLSSLNDILTGSLMYLVNGSNEVARKALQKQLESVMWHGPEGRYSDYGMSLRPANKSGLDPTIATEYDALRFFLNSSHR